MAVGRISGPLLKSNLLRNGIDLAFETDLLYLDVNNQRIGIKTANPHYELDVNGTIRATNLIADNSIQIDSISVNVNTISSTQPTLNLGTLDNVVFQNKARIDSIECAQLIKNGLKKTEYLNVICSYNSKFNKWIPIKITN